MVPPRPAAGSSRRGRSGAHRHRGRRPPARPRRRRPSGPPGAPPAPRAAAGRPDPAPEPPAANRAGSYSLARQLGLGVRRIVIDAGHGGHDPGTIGRGGLQEKDLVLDVALRLERLVRQELGAEVVLTRSTDVFIPLEERTAIANSRGADLFLSIHANASRNPGARGIETYFLNFAQSPHAEAVAARENAISPATLKDLQNLVKAITLNSKIDESRDFAAAVQESMVAGVRQEHAVRDRGVHTAPFYVLIGANMPAVLAEIAFVSNPEDERRLKTPEYREVLARSLLSGVKSYLEALEPHPDAAIDRRRPALYSGRGARGTLRMLTIGPAVTWIKVEKPVFDLVGVVLGSFHLAGILLLLAFVLGRHLRRRPHPVPPPARLHHPPGPGLPAPRGDERRGDNARRQGLAFPNAARYIAVVTPDKAAPGPRPIRRYGNRKLYDPATRRYVTLEDLARLVADGHEIEVIEQKTGEDLTNLTLAQVLLEGVKQGASRIPRQVLTRLIRIAAGPASAWGEWPEPQDTASRARQEAERIVSRRPRPRPADPRRRRDPASGPRPDGPPPGRRSPIGRRVPPPRRPGARRGCGRAFPRRAARGDRGFRGVHRETRPAAAPAASAGPGRRGRKRKPKK